MPHPSTSIRAGLQPTNLNTSDGHAVVVGASMSGLMAARVLTDYFEQVTIIDRDRLPTQPEFRKGTPQAHHVHVYAAAGPNNFRATFPWLSS